MSHMYYNFILRRLFILRLLNNQRDYIDRKGVHVVVGHYIGDSVDPMKAPNITKGKLRNKLHILIVNSVVPFVSH